jgi:hypothetical protein
MTADEQNAIQWQKNKRSVPYNGLTFPLFAPEE